MAAPGPDLIEAAPADAVGGGRGRILGAARALFTAHGYAAVSMQQIADAARVNKATLYHHFDDKEDLFVAVMREEFARSQAGIGAALAPAGPLREQLRRVALHVFASTQSGLGHLAADLREHVSEERRRELLRHCALPWDILRPAFERAIAAGEIRPVDPDLAAQLFFGMVNSQIWWTKFGDDRPAPDARTAATIVDVLLDGLGSCPPQPPVDRDLHRSRLRRRIEQGPGRPPDTEDLPAAASAPVVLG